jgi:ketosteroid isomerase-like protein
MMRKSIKVLLLSVFLGGYAAAFAADADEARVQEVTEQVQAFNAAYERNELDAYFGYYAPDATLLFDSGRVALADYRKDWYGLIEQGGRVERNVVSDLAVQMAPGNTTAIATYRLDVETRMSDGRVTTDRAHETDVWFLVDGKWRIAHLHYTVER